MYVCDICRVLDSQFPWICGGELPVQNALSLPYCMHYAAMSYQASILSRCHSYLSGGLRWHADDACMFIHVQIVRIHIFVCVCALCAHANIHTCVCVCMWASPWNFVSVWIFLSSSFSGYIFLYLEDWLSCWIFFVIRFIFCSFDNFFCVQHVFVECIYCFWCILWCTSECGKAFWCTWHLQPLELLHSNNSSRLVWLPMLFCLFVYFRYLFIGDD